MSGTWAIALREYRSLFRVPLGWIVIALYLLIAGFVFSYSVLEPGGPASMRPFFQYAFWTLIVVAPAISMRLFSEEIRSGTIEPLLTAPVPEFVVTLGKYLASVLFLATMLAPTLVYVGLIELLSRPDHGPVLSGYLGVLLLGMLYLAIGCLASSLTSSQTLAFLGTLFVLALVEILALLVAPLAPPFIRQFLFSLSVMPRISDFARGLVGINHVAFFLVASAWFLVLASIVLQSRRWR